MNNTILSILPPHTHPPTRSELPFADGVVKVIEVHNRLQHKVRPPHFYFDTLT